jgi:hypothetical protein
MENELGYSGFRRLLRAGSDLFFHLKNDGQSGVSRF